MGRDVGELVGLGYGQGRGAEEGRAARARVDAMSGVVQGLGLLLDERSG